MANANTEHRKLAAIMFTDMVGYSALAQRNEALALELLEEHRSLLRALFPRFNGVEVKTIGDAFLVEFLSALEAAQCAIEIQRTLAKRNHDVPAERRIEVKIGIHIGDVVHRGGDVYGDGVNIASRIEPLAGAGGICISMDVERQIRSALEARFEKLGPTELKNIQLPMELFRIVLPWEKQGSSSLAGGAPARRQSAIRPLAVAMVAFFILAIASWWLVNRLVRAPAQVVNSLADGQRQGALVEQQKSIAVLPFRNRNLDQADEYLCDGIADQIRLALMKVTGLHVAAETSSSAFKGRTEENILRKIGEQLHVRTVLEGSVQKSGPRLLISTKLINVNDGYMVWSETYDQQSQDLISIQLAVARKVVEELKVQLLPDERQRLTKKPTTNDEALQLYLNGRFQLYQMTESGFRQAVALFDQAIAKDPAFALAHAAKAEAYALVGHSWFVPPGEATALAYAASTKAIKLDDSLAEAHMSLATTKMFDYDWTGADREFLQAIERNPRHAPTRMWYGLALCFRGQWNEATEQFQRARELDPLSAVVATFAAWPAFLRRQYDSALAEYQKAIELDPNLFFAHEFMGWVYVQKEMYPQAIESLQKAITVSNRHQEVIGMLGYIHGLTGNTVQARKLLEELETRAKTARYVSPVYAAMIHGVLGEMDEAFALLQQAANDRDINLAALVKDHPCFDCLRADARYTALLKQVGLDR